MINEIPLFYIWGHSFEFDRENTWELIEKFCEKVAFKEDTWYTTNVDYCSYITAMRSLIFNVENTRVFNPTAYSIWLNSGKGILELKPGMTAEL